MNVPTATPAIRCYDCGQFFPATEITRQNIHLGFMVGATTQGIGAGLSRIERVDLCSDCVWQRKATRQQMTRIIGVASVVLLLLFVFGTILGLVLNAH